MSALLETLKRLDEAEAASLPNTRPVVRPTPPRVEMLHEGAKLTYGARDLEYGDPKGNFTLIGELKAVLRQHATRDLSPAEWHAADMVCVKLARAVTGAPKRDTFVDGATYFAIFGELALDA